MTVQASRIGKDALPKRRKKRRPWGWIAFFIGPALIVYLAFQIVPLFMTFYNSVHILHMADWTQEYVGLEHYKQLVPHLEKINPDKEKGLLFGLLPYKLKWPDDIFRKAVRNSFTWAFISPVLEISLALLLALILYTKIPFTRFFRIAWFSPMLVSWVFVGIIFRWILNAKWGIVNVVLRNIGLGAFAANWLGAIRPRGAWAAIMKALHLKMLNLPLLSMIGITTWKFTGFNMVILLAGLSGIPLDLLDAARIDGCNRIQMVWHVIIPLLRATIVNLLIMCFIGKMKQFALVWVATMGGPMHETETVATYVQRRAFDWRTLDLGYPSAIAVLWFVVILVLSLIFTRILQSREVLEF